MDAHYVVSSATPMLVPLVCAIGAVISAGRARRRGAPAGETLEIWMRWWFRGAIAVGAAIVGVSFLIAPDFMATTIGFVIANDFQREIAFANLGFALSAVLAVRLGFGARAAVTAGYAVFMWGATVGHIWQSVVLGDHAPGNTGGILVYDVVIPAVALVLVAVQWRTRSSARSGRTRAARRRTSPAAPATRSARPQAAC
ncbi:DUF6790 family protein [Pseudonocardia sp. KRD291]|uniref:DUF6790 family protein n=1 Tax=Pseudonocardia sp. KRD291 TaxID=2792007 RepID=UPI001C4A5867|nr:DUF6790 family protein [Pseudonocardia sp. KRD291]MBW0102475.1 hypothetical protein [Pseudonocardia sp. KRD291]